MTHRKLFLNLIILFILPLLSLWLSLAGLSGVAQAASAPVVRAERSELALPSALPPTSTILSSNTVAENQITGTMVGTFTTNDADSLDTHTYTFTDTGSFPDNAFFNITGDTLNTAAEFNFEVPPTSYTIRVLTTDSGNDTVETTFTIIVTDVAEDPANIDLSNSSVAENLITNTIVGTFSTTDPDDLDANDTYTYTLISGNSNFNISGNQLRTSVMFNFEAGASHNIRVRTTDSGGKFFEKDFTITINNVNEAPTDIGLNDNNVDENLAVGTLVGTFSATDPDAGNTHTFSLVSGSGSADNGSFNIINGNQLVTNAIFNYEVDNSYSIRVRATDNGGLPFDEVFTITINNVNEAPTDMSLSITNVNENRPVNTIVGTFTTTDPDNPGAGQTHTYSLVSITGCTDSSQFNINNNQLRTSAVFDYQADNSYCIRVRTTDNGTPNLSYEEQFTITVNDVFPTINVDKTANPTSVPETGANVNFTIQINNTSQENATIFDFEDSDFNLDTRCPDWPNKVINAGQVYTCVFTQFISGDFGSPSHVNTADATVKDNENHNTNDLDNATVAFTDVLPNIIVTKTANPITLVEPGGNVTFSVLVTNNSTEAAKLNSLNDNVYGNLNGQGTCVANGTGTIAPNGGTYSCSFTKLISGSPGTNHVNTVTAQVSDDDTNSTSANDNATVSITPILKTFLPLLLKDFPVTQLSVFNDNTGGNVIFTVLGTGVSCTVPNNTTQFCGSFSPGTYTVQVTSACGNATTTKIYAAGPQTTRIFCTP